MLAAAQRIEFNDDAIAGLQGMFAPTDAGQHAGTGGQLERP